MHMNYSRDAVTCPVAFDLIHKLVTLKSYIKLFYYTYMLGITTPTMVTMVYNLI